MKKEKTLLVSGWDEWHGPIYFCPFCSEEKLMDDFNFCPACGSNLKDFKFESEEEEQERVKKEKWIIK